MKLPLSVAIESEIYNLRMSELMKELVEQLLFSEEYADLHFEFEDGTRIPAHKNIVFKRAPYFK